MKVSVPLRGLCSEIIGRIVKDVELRSFPSPCGVHVLKSLPCEPCCDGAYRHGLRRRFILGDISCADSLKKTVHALPLLMRRGFLL